LVGVTIIDYRLCMAWQNMVCGGCEVFADLQVREAAAKLDVMAAIRMLHADGMRPGKGGTPWKKYIPALTTLTGRPYNPRHIRRLIPQALADRTSESEQSPVSPIDLAENV
jgi:hypothetical protein